MSEYLPLTDDAIKRLVGDTIFNRGVTYFRNGAVLRVVRRGPIVSAEVEGSEDEPYAVQVTLDEQGVANSDCTCPYDDTCKHIVAVLLTLLHRPEVVEDRPPLDQLLAPLDREQLTVLLRQLALRPGIADAVDDLLATPLPAASGSARAPVVRHITLSPDAARRQMQRLLNRDMYDDYGGMVAADDIERILAHVQALIEAGDGHAALALLEPAAEEFFAHWYEVEEECELSDLIPEIGETLAEALLTVNLPLQQRSVWLHTLGDWYDAAAEYGADDGLAVALAAAEQGWDYAPLRQVLAGQIGPSGAWNGPAPFYADTLARVRLRILDRQARTAEYLRLAEAEGLVVEYATMLARTGRVDAAVAVAFAEFDTGDEALTLARLLYEQGAVAAALAVAESGLTINEPTGPLAAWLTDLAQAQGRGELALRAARQAFRAHPSLEGYRKAQQLAGDAWPKVRHELLAALRAANNWQHAGGKVAVLLSEGLLDDAIAVVEQGSSGGEVLAKVMDAARTERPDWVIARATRAAEAIMDAGKADRYGEAIGWLRRARNSYLAADRADEWLDYLRGVRHAHGRKYKLMGMLPQLDR